MARHSFFCPDLIANKNKILLNNKEEIHHLTSVLRLKKDDGITIFNGKGLAAQGVIKSISKNTVEVEAISFITTKPSTPLIVLACAVPKRSKFETIIEKSTELGVDEIIPLKTTRTEIKVSAAASSRQNTRYQDVAINAAKQCGRSFLPQIHPLTDFKNVLSQISSNDLAIIGSLKGEPKRLPDIKILDTKEKGRIIVFIGPEGDFTDEEIASAIQKSCIPVTLGPNVLKVETAALSSISYLMLLLRS